MNQQRVLAIDITLPNISVLYSVNTRNAILNIFNDNWRDRCYLGQYIVRGIQVLEHSRARQIHDIDTKLNVSIKVLCDVIHWTIGDTIMCRVDSINLEGVELSSSHLSARMETSQLAKQTKIGDTIPVIVEKCMYMTGAKYISAIVVPYQRVIDPNIYSCITKEDDKEVNIDLSREEVTYAEVVSKNKQAAQYLLTKHKYVKSPSKLIQDIRNGLSHIGDDMYIARDEQCFLRASCSAVRTPKDESKVIKQTRSVIHALMMASYKRELMAFVTILEHCADLASIKRLDYIWNGL